jgi:hypothetical protein
MKSEVRDALAEAVTQALLDALTNTPDGKRPKAAIIKAAAEWIEKHDRKLVSSPTEKEKAQQDLLRERVRKLPFPTPPAADQPRREPPSPFGSSTRDA